MGKVVVVVVVAALVVFGFRLRSQAELQDRVVAYQDALRRKALAPKRGTASVPSEDEIVERAEALADELKVHVSDLEATVTRDADPTGAGAMAAEQLGGIGAGRTVDADGNVVQLPAKRLKTTLIEVRAHVRVEGFLCSLDRDVEAKANMGYDFE